MEVLTSLERRGMPMSLMQVAQGAGMQPSRVHRYLVSLGRIGLVTQSPASGLYDLGPALRRLGAEALRRTDEVGTASAHLPGLRDRTGHSVNLAVWGEKGPVVLRWDYGSYPLPITVRAGTTLPLGSSSLGMVCLAYLPSVVTDPVLEAELAAVGDPAAARDRLREQVEVIRDRGYALTSGTVIPGVASVAAPVFDSAGSLSLAVSVAMPATWADADAVAGVATDLLVTTRAVSAELGWSAPG